MRKRFISLIAVFAVLASFIALVGTASAAYQVTDYCLDRSDGAELCIGVFALQNGVDYYGVQSNGHPVYPGVGVAPVRSDFYSDAAYSQARAYYLQNVSAHENNFCRDRGYDARFSLNRYGGTFYITCISVN